MVQYSFNAVNCNIWEAEAGESLLIHAQSELHRKFEYIQQDMETPLR